MAYQCPASQMKQGRNSGISFVFSSEPDHLSVLNCWFLFYMLKNALETKLNFYFKILSKMFMEYNMLLQ